MSEDNIITFNPWQDFNDVSGIIDPADVEPDLEQLNIFIDMVFSYCEGLIPVRGFVDKGTGKDGRPNNIWIDANDDALGKLATFTNWAWRQGAAVYVVPGTVATPGLAKSEDIIEMQTIVVDLDDGDIGQKLKHLVDHLGKPTLLVESGGRTPEGQQKCHVWWKLTEPVRGADIERLCRIRGEIAAKVGGDWHFRSAHQPIRVAGSVYHKGGFVRAVRILERHANIEIDLNEFAEMVSAMPAFPGVLYAGTPEREKPSIDEVLLTPVRESGQDRWTRFEGASSVIGYYIRQIHQGRITADEGWETICGYNAAMLRPPWPLDRLKQEFDRLWSRHIEHNGPALIRTEAKKPATALQRYRLRALMADTSPMPMDLIGPRVLTPGGLMVLGGAPKVGKSDFLVNLLVHMAAGQPFLGFTPGRPLRIFYFQAEIQYHYLRERLQALPIHEKAFEAAQDNLVVTPKLKLILDEKGTDLAIAAIKQDFGNTPPDIVCIDPIRNVFDGGADGGGENDNAAMMFFLTARVEKLRDAINPDCGIILAHHTRKISKQQVSEDPFLALSGASALRGFYTSGLLMHRPDEEDTTRKLEIELRNGPALRSKLIDKVKGKWVELNPINERLVRKDVGAKLDAERLRKHDVILGILLDEASEGRLYTTMQFAEALENKVGLGSKHTIRDRLSVLATKGFVKFLRDGTPFGYPVVRSRWGYLCVEDMAFPPLETFDEVTGEVTATPQPVHPSHYKCAHSGACLDVENPTVWVYPKGGDDDLTPQE